MLDASEAAMKRASKKIPWSQTAEGQAAYDVARAAMQAAANADGFDRGIEANDLFKEWRIFTLPRRENRTGFELRCEVVSCEDLSKCQPGHGPAR
jgi:hypothetical protein